jgi:putative transcriptional regulator
MEDQMAVSDDDFETVLAGLAEAKAFLAGAADQSGYRVHVPNAVDVRDIRRRLGLSQTAFAARFGFSPGAVRDWEQGRRRPEASARMFLTVIDKQPEAVMKALA